MELKRPTLAAFTGPALPLAAMGLPLVVYLPPYYAGTLGLNLATVGLIFFVLRLVDLPLDPVLGHLMDRTRAKLGRYRPWAIGGMLMMIAGTYMVFMAEPGISAGRAFAQLLFMYVGYSVLFVAHYGWAASLSGDYHERSRVFGWVQAAAVLGMVIVLALPPLVARLSGNGGAATGVQAMGWFVIASAPLTVALAVLTVGERPPADTAEPTFADVKALAKNRLVRRLLAIDVFAGLAPGTTGAMFIFYFEHRLGFSAPQASLLLLFYFVAGFAAAPLWVALARRLGKHRAMAVAMFTYCVLHAALALLPAGGFNEAIVGMLLAGIPYTALYFFPRAMLADVGDVDRLKTGLDRNGLLQAVLTTTSKIAHAAPVAIIYPILAAIHFDPKPGAANTPDAVLGMTLLFVLVPVALVLAAGWLVARWPHDEKAHADVQAALAAREAGPAA